MKLLVCATEYHPSGSGIANVAYNVVECLKEQGVECTVCSPTGPDIKLGNQKLIEKTGIFGMLYYWHQVSQYLKKNDYDALWLHNPFITGGDEFTQATAGQIVHDVQEVMGKAMHVDVEVVEEIPRDKSGKVRCAVSNVRSRL